MLDAVVEFPRRLRWLGMDVSIVDLTGAMGAVRGADLLDRDRLFRLVMVTLAKRAASAARGTAAVAVLRLHQLSDWADTLL